MQNSNKLTSFTLSNNEKYIFAGSLSGYLKIISLAKMRLVNNIFIHVGAIQAVTAHQNKDLIATRSMDNSIALIDIKDIHNPRIIDRYVVRDIKADNDEVLVKPNYSFSQAIDFHPLEDKIATRNGSAAILELDFKSNCLVPINCFRLHKDEDLTTVKYVLNGDYLLSGGRGEIFLSKNGKKEYKWSTPVSNNHWFEQLTAKSYLVANDARRLIKINLEKKPDIEYGPIFCRDDFEHVTYNAKSNLAYCAGFDGEIYEIDPSTLLVLKIVWTAPFKMRWIFSLKGNPNILIFHCFNGSIYKLNISTKEIKEFKPDNQPYSIWTSVKNNGNIYFAGEGKKIINYKLKINSNIDSTTELKLITKYENIKSRSYTKRICFSENKIISSEKNGKIFSLINNKFDDIIDLKEEIRDICINKTKNLLYACTERGNIHSIDLNSNLIRNTYKSKDNKPLWSLALQAKNNLLAVAESHGEISLVNSLSMKELKYQKLISDRPKRMKWLDKNLLFVEGVSLKRYDLVEDKVFNYIEECDNTIEDFIWNEDYGYLILIGYMKEIILCDLSSGRKLYSTSDQLDFSLGLEWINIPKEKNSYPLDFVTYGTSGNLQAYRVHNDRIISLGRNYESILS